MTALIRILTADDHHLIRAGVASFLATEPGLQVVAEAANGEEITPRIRALPGNDTALVKAQLQKWARGGQKLRASGWLLFDPDHPSEVGKSRGTTWEIHPVMRVRQAP